MEFSFLETGKTSGGIGYRETNSSFFGHVKFEMSSRHPSGNVLIGHLIYL